MFVIASPGAGPDRVELGDDGALTLGRGAMTWSGRTTCLDEPLWASPRDYLLERAGGRAPSRERPSPRVTTEVVVDDRASPRHTVIEVFAKDRPGLLHAVAQELYELGLGIALSKINTEGSRVADVFYVNERDGAKVAPGERFKEIRTRLKRAISEEAQ